MTVTHPHAERTFVSAAEAARLLLEALSLDTQGSVLALAAGEKTNIAKLAQRLISAHGQQAGNEVEIEYSGVRRGERLVEHVTLDGTQWLPTPHEHILVCGLDGPAAPAGGLEHSIRKLVLIAQGGDSNAVLGQLPKTVPDYSTDTP